MSYASIQTPLGPLGISWDGEALTGIDLEPERSADPDADAVVPQFIACALDAYFADGHRAMAVPVRLVGTQFQRRVWSALCAIQPGQTRTYGELARELGSAPRAVGQACRANPCPLAVPCHRVVAATGLGGFAGDRSGRKLAVKRWLLRHEGVTLPATED